MRLFDALEWMASGRCAQVDPDLWHPEQGGSPLKAKAICSGCPVREECLEYALTVPEELTGVWGGTTTRQRRAMRREAAA